MSEPDLFVVCKNCSSEVSPYVTECPYCGQRVRKRAPKIEKAGPMPEEPRRRRRAPVLPKLRRGEMPGIAADTKPYATGVLVALSLLSTLVWTTGAVSVLDLGAILGPIGNEWWRVVTTPFIHENAGYQFVALVAVALFGVALERRHGKMAAAVGFLLCGTAGAALAVSLDLLPALGANGAALGLLCAWAVDERRSARRTGQTDADALGAAVFAAVLVGLSLAEPSASIAAAAGGALTGSLLGLALAVRR